MLMKSIKLIYSQIRKDIKAFSIWALSQENLILVYASNKGAEQTRFSRDEINPLLYTL